MGEQDRGYHADRIQVSYWDEMGNETVRNFAANLPDEEIPGTLNAGHALPTVAQALIFIALYAAGIASGSSEASVDSAATASPSAPAAAAARSSLRDLGSPFGPAPSASTGRF